ncbi:MAG: hypothetical protein Q4F21_04830 [Lachnospiraceae bacterium]|nr:hypothetical protein [Lachnospiraceae bacterium]
MKRFWEDINDENLDVLQEFLESDMKYEGCKEIEDKFKEKIGASTVLKTEKVKMNRNKTVKNEAGKSGKRKKLKIYMVLAAVLVLVCSIGAAASYGKWYPQNPGTYKGDSVKVHGTSSYTWDESKQDYVGEKEKEKEKESSSQVLSSAEFLQKAQAVLQMIGAESVDVSKMKLQYQKNEVWNREEVEITFPMEGNQDKTSVTFDRESGNFLKAHFWRGENSNQGTVMSDKKALEAARGWYERLPYPQGYQYTNVSKIDDHCWMYSFCRNLDIELNGKTVSLRNPYEEARISIDPTNGKLILCNSFYVPLLDDHKEGDVPLTEQEARKIADKACSESILNDKTTKVAAEIEIVHPKYEVIQSYREKFSEETDKSIVQKALTEEKTVITEIAGIEKNYHNYSVTRLAWKISYEKPDELFKNITYVYVDLYTGEILLQDRIG